MPSCAWITKADFQDEANLKPVFDALKAAQVEARDAARTKSTPPGRRGIPRFDAMPSGASAWRLLSQPEYRRFRTLAKTDRALQRAAVRGGEGRASRNAAQLARPAELRQERRQADASVQRYKGLGEMNAEQLAETTMNPEKRTLLQVRLEDAVESEEIFSTLMGEDVESRRKFIEENALDVKNLDV